MPNILAFLAEADSAALHLKSAESGTELYRRRLEEARAQLDGARGREGAAKAALEAIYSRVAEECAVPRRTVKETVEERVAGLIASELFKVAPLTEDVQTAAAATAEAPARPKATRGPRTPKVADATEASTTTPAPVEGTGVTDGTGEAELNSDAGAGSAEEGEAVTTNPATGTATPVASEADAVPEPETPAMPDAIPLPPAPAAEAATGTETAAAPASPVTAARPSFLPRPRSLTVPGLGG